ncbi:MAG: hypothetical protein WCF95_05805, partial [bacterium]
NEVFDIKAIEGGVSDLIAENDCKKLVLNLKGFNLVDAGSITVLASAYHYSKYSKEGIFKIIVDSEEIKKALSHAKLDNTEIVVEDSLNSMYCTA